MTGRPPVPAPFDPTGATLASGGGYPPSPGYPPPITEDDTLDLRRLLGILRRNWWVVLACVGAALALGWVLTQRAVPDYESAASLRIAEAEAAVPGLEALQALGAGGSEVNTELEVLRSRTLAGQVVDELQLRLAVVRPRKLLRGQVFSAVQVGRGAVSGEYLLRRDGEGFVVATPDSQTVRVPPDRAAVVAGVTLTVRPGAASTGPVQFDVLPREEAITRLSEALRVSRPSRDANILVVRYRGPDPSLVEAVPNALVTAFVDQRLGTRKTGARSTVEFLRTQLDTLRVELRAAEDTLRRFREQEQVVSVAQQASVSVSRLAEVQAMRDQAASELAAIEATLAQARDRAAGSGGTSAYRRLLAFPTLLRNPLISTLLENVTTLENQRTTLLVRRTERDPDVQALSTQIEGLEDQIQSIVGTYTDGLRQQVAALDGDLARSGSELARIPAREVRFATLQRDATVLGELSTLLQTRLKEAEIAQAVEDPSAQVVDLAIRPSEPVSPRPVLNLALAALLGLLVSGTIMFGRELLDTKLHTREDLQQASGGLPVLGVIPRFEAQLTRQVRAAHPARRREDKASTALVAREDPGATVLEAYRALRTSLAFSGVDRAPRVIVVTSPTPDDGKSTSTANLAASLAQQKLRVLVIDADMRRGAMHRTLGGGRAPGLSEVLAGHEAVDGVVQHLTFDGVGRIDLISTGTIPPNPAELLGSPRLPDLLEALEPRYDTILIDTPPVNVVSDVMVLAPLVDGVLLVARGGKTERGAVRFALEQLATVRARVLGTVLNDYDFRRAASYGGEYYRYYHGAGYGPPAQG